MGSGSAVPCILYHKGVCSGCGTRVFFTLYLFNFMYKQVKMLRLICVVSVLICCALSALVPESQKVKPTATRGMMIDAGSGGSRLHVYSWKPRQFKTIPIPLSYPEGNEQWTSRMSPGIATFADSLSLVSGHLAPLIEFAKATLVDSSENYRDYPIYFYATGGMRQLTAKKRERIIDEVRKYLSNETLCPFFFKPNFARIISGSFSFVNALSVLQFSLCQMLSFFYRQAKRKQYFHGPQPTS
jgi:hypothetical protein